MNTRKVQELRHEFDLLFCDDFVLQCAKTELLNSMQAASVEIEVAEGQFCKVDLDDEFHVVSKALFVERFGIEFGVAKALIAIGDCRESGGIVTTSKFFCTIHFDINLDVISFDVHQHFV